MESVELQFKTSWGIIAGKAWGNPSNTPVLAIHGFHDNAATFDHLIPSLSTSSFFVCLDLPGHGRSSPYPAGVSLDFFSCLRDVCQVLITNLKWTRCTLMSHSAGGHICLFIAAIYPEIVEKVILLDMFLYFVILNHEEICTRLRYLFEQSFQLESSECSYADETEALKKFLTNHFSPINKLSATKLLSRMITKTNQGTIKIRNDRRRDLLPLPILSLDLHLAVINHIRAEILAITFKETERLLEKEPSNFETTRLLENVLGTRMRRLSVEGTHNVHLDYPERIAYHINRFIRNEPLCLL
ncbi:serine hydrolase-like protein [Nilaparvata lugens]|uniref:serine hydrolase-like protein n=1 Tax=Nilaparvata lugens TaxID=108931 RepID=UPI00193E9486|nr:serine hydrolase-like protein [Nilaparvata lugens]